MTDVLEIPVTTLSPPPAARCAAQPAIPSRAGGIAGDGTNVSTSVRRVAR